jgi:hypothetical protein
MRELLINLELKLADLLIQEKMLRNCDPIIQSMLVILSRYVVASSL